VTYGGNGLRSTPVIDHRAYADLPADVHQSFHTWSTRARLDQVNGNHQNHVILVDGPPQRAVTSPVRAFAIAQMDQWLTNLMAVGPLGRANLDQIGRAKPADLVDACYTDGGATKIAEPQVYRGDTRCNTLYRPSSTPRMEAGGPLANNVLKCQLKPLSAADYKIQFSLAEWEQLKAIFPDGVCDWSRPGVGQSPSQTWSRFK
jgi:hypothetical protein